MVEEENARKAILRIGEVMEKERGYKERRRQRREIMKEKKKS